jgi:hypothetical protein
MMRLPRTPSPHANEALFAYMLRLSEANSYRSPRYLAYTANVPRTHWLRPYPSYPSTKLSPLIGGHEEALERMGYNTIVGNTVHSKLLDHDLGRHTTALMRLRVPALCVECVKEDGYIRAFWDLAAAVACPRHGRLAVERCQACDEPLTWYRPGLLTCLCNADIGGMTRSLADDLLIDLMRVLEAKIERRPLIECSVASPFPLRSFEAMPLYDLLRVIQVLGEAGEFGGSVGDKRNARGADAVGLAARLLLDWPRHLVGWLESVDRSHGLHVGTRVVSRIVTALFRRRPLSDGLQQLRDALSPVLRARRGAVDTIPSAAEGRRGQNENAKAGPGQSAFRVAVARLGIPPSTLNLLRSRGSYQSEVERRGRQPWRPAELEAFGQRLLALAAGRGVVTGGVKLKALLARKYRNAVVKAELVEAVLRGLLPVVGLDGDKPADLLLDSDAVGRWVREARLREGNGAITIAEAAREVDLNPAAIPAAISAGLLDTVVVDENTRVTLASADRFRERYISIVQLARRLNTSSSRLVRFVEGHGVRVIRLTRAGECDADQPIIPRDLESRVEALWAEEVVREAAEKKTRANPGPVRLEALAAYLKSMKARGKRLPDKSKIARACGFERNEFYMRPELARQLDLSREEQQQRAGQPCLEPIERLRAYLKNLSTAGGQIPLWGGKPKLLAIAAACGIDRSLFYKDPEARRLVNDLTHWQKDRR